MLLFFAVDDFLCVRIVLVAEWILLVLNHCFLRIQKQNFLESVGDYITDICYLACKHKVKLEAAFINAALACEIMEGLASSLYPDMQVQTVALPMVLKAEMMHGLKGLPSPRLWSLK